MARDRGARMPVRILRNYVNGEWIDPAACDALDVENPSTGGTIARVPLSRAADLDAAVAAARGAFPAWSTTPVDKRVAPLFRLAALIRDNRETLARQITEENGKSLPDARAEVDRTLENVETACGMPIGVFAMIAPFNFPAMVPFWFIPYAVATGNTFVVKPSEQVPCTLQILAEYIDRCGFPRGVFNLVNGDRRVAEAIVAHPGVAGVSVVGRTATAQAIAEACVRTRKRFQAMGGAKNHLVVMPDARMDEAIRN